MLFDHLYQPARNLKAVSLTDREAQVIGRLLDELRGGEFGDLARDMSNRIANRLGSAGTPLPDGQWNGVPDGHLDTIADGREQG